MDILAIVPSFKRLTSSRCDDWVDRINHVYTTILLLVFATLITAAQYIGEPIYCWIPPEYLKKDGPQFKDYIHNYCWIKNTYYIPMFKVIPKNISERQEEEIAYYQWVPIILLVQAFLFKLPNTVWKLLHEGSGLNIDKLCKNAESTQGMSPEERKDAYEGLVFTVQKWISGNQPYKDTRLSRAKLTCSRLIPFCGNKRNGTYLVGLYLITKVLYLANAVGQLFLLNDFITTDTRKLYALDWIQSFQSMSPRFPRVTLCDFNIRQLMNVQRFTVQCVLPINLFNEKVFLFLWFWCLLVACLSLYSVIKWLFLIVLKRNNYEYVKKYLKIGGRILQQSDKEICKKFSEKLLRDDGCFVARMISMNSTDMVVTDMLSDLFRHFREKEEPNESEDDNENKRNKTGRQADDDLRRRNSRFRGKDSIQ